MAASAIVDVIGTAPISLTDSTGAQKSVPLSALTFSWSKPDIADDWAPEFDKAADKATVFAVATARVAAGELTPTAGTPSRGGQHDGIRRPPPQPTRRGGYRRRDLTDRNTSDKH
jgi:hypothetical protein